MTDADVVAPPVGARVLVADDEKHLAVLLEHFLAGRGHHVQVVHDGRAALAAITEGAFDVALLDVQMPGLDGLAVLRASQDLPLPPQVIVMTGNGTIDTTVAALQAGAYDAVAKPYRMAEVDLLVRRAAERRRLDGAQVAHRATWATGEVVATSAPMRAAVDAVVRAAPSLGALLLVGEPGSGRATLARLAHREGGGGAFVELHAGGPDAADPRELATRLAAAHHGTLFLRGVEALPADAQRAVSAALAGPVTVRVIGSTARPPESLGLDAGLGARFTALTVAVPPLRERLDELPALASAFVRQFAGASAAGLDESALALLRAHPWPGNVAELRLVIEGAVARAGGAAVGPDHLALDSLGARRRASPAPTP